MQAQMTGDGRAKRSTVKRRASEVGELLHFLVRLRYTQCVVALVETLEMTRVGRPVDAREKRLVVARLVIVVRCGE